MVMENCSWITAFVRLNIIASSAIVTLSFMGLRCTGKRANDIFSLSFHPDFYQVVVRRRFISPKTVMPPA